MGIIDITAVTNKNNMTLPRQICSAFMTMWCTKTELKTGSEYWFSLESIVRYDFSKFTGNVASVSSNMHFEENTVLIRLN